MRNLKKILALVLALVMSLSLMATVSATETTSAADPYKTAETVLEGLGVFQGDVDGDMHYDRNISRAEAATLVYRVATADVNDIQKDIYTNNPFTDVALTSWANGYISYCYNAEIIKGTSPTTFDPEDPVTGHAILAMVLRTLGYGKQGEFTGSSWEIQTAATAKTAGLLEGVTAADEAKLGQAAPRRLVAKILFNALLQNTVTYNAFTPYSYPANPDKLGARLGLEELTGVVTANEIADLEDVTPLAANKTRLNVDGKDYVLDVPSEATDIGETRHAYVNVKANNHVLTVLEDTNTNKTNNQDGKAVTLAKVIKDMGVRLTDDTQYFVNFGDSEQYTCEYRLEFNVTFEAATIDGKAMTAEQIKKDFEDEYDTGDLVKDAGMTKNGNTYSKIIRAEKNITVNDLAVIRGIINAADNGTNGNIYEGIKGDLYAGTKSSQDKVDKSNDLSDDLSYREFYNKYIAPASYNITGSDNGEWFKVIDNNNDGNVDYVLLTTFVMTTVTDYNARTGMYTTEWTSADEEDNHTKFLDIDEDDIVYYECDGISVDDVILYAKIDGKYYINTPAPVNGTISKFDYKAKTITCGDVLYDWSEIEKEARAFYTEITDFEVVRSRPYALYLDFFGNVRLVTDVSKDFTLLTDGYYKTDLRNDVTLKATIYNLDTEELEDVNVVNAGKAAYALRANDGYIDTWEDDHKGNAGTWTRLIPFDQYRYGARATNPAEIEEFWTNVARTSVSESGVYTLADIGAYNSRNSVYNSYAVDTAKLDANDRYMYGYIGLDAANQVTGTQRINANNQTRYYWVHTVDNKTVVDTWVGFNGIPEDLKVTFERAYAITSTVSTVAEGTANYEIAEVVVFEGAKGGPGDTVKAMIPYAYAENKLAQGLGWNGSDYDDEVRIDSDPKKNAIEGSANDLFQVFTTAGKLIQKNYGSVNVWAGHVVTDDGTLGKADYDDLSRDDGGVLYAADDVIYGEPAAKYNPGETDKAYRIIDERTGNLKGYAVEAASLQLGDYVIYFVEGTGKNTEAKLVINVTQSDPDLQPELIALWDKIATDYTRYKHVPITQYYNGSDLQLGAYDVYDVTADGKIQIKMSDLALDGMELIGYTVISDGKVTVNRILDDDGDVWLTITDLKGGEEIRLRYNVVPGADPEENPGPVVIDNNGGKDEEDNEKIYTNFQLMPDGAGSALKASSSNTLAPGASAILYFDVKDGYEVGEITVSNDSEPLEVEQVTEIPEGVKAAGEGYSKYAAGGFTMPKDDEPLVITLGEPEDLAETALNEAREAAQTALDAIAEKYGIAKDSAAYTDAKAYIDAEARTADELAACVNEDGKLVLIEDEAFAALKAIVAAADAEDEFKADLAAAKAAVNALTEGYEKGEYSDLKAAYEAYMDVLDAEDLTAEDLELYWDGENLIGTMKTELEEAVETAKTTLPAAKNGTIKLVGDVTLAEAYTVEAATTINLNNHNITGALVDLIVAKADLTITGEGTISNTTATEDTNDVIYVAASDVTVTIGEKVTLAGYDQKAGSYYYGVGIYVGSSTDNVTGVVIELNGKITGGTGIQMYGYAGGTTQFVNRATVNLNANSTIDVEDIGVGMNGNCTVNVKSKATIVSKGAGVEVKAGTLNVADGCSITGDSEGAWSNGQTPAGGGTQASGAAISVSSYNQVKIVVDIKGGDLAGAVKLGLAHNDNKDHESTSATVNVIYPENFMDEGDVIVNTGETKWTEKTDGTGYTYPETVE